MTTVWLLLILAGMRESWLVVPSLPSEAECHRVADEMARAANLTNIHRCIEYTKSK